MDAATDRQQQRRAGLGGDLDRWRDARREQWDRGDRHLVYTLVAVIGLSLLGAIVVPLSIPDAVAGPSQAELRAQEFVAAISAPNAPTLVRTDASSTPAVDTIQTELGADGGEACTAPVADAYATLLAKNARGGMSFDRTAHARMQVVHQVYCPERDAELTEFVTTRNAANARARAAAQREGAANAA